jgi:hypothetical protein
MKHDLRYNFVPCGVSGCRHGFQARAGEALAAGWVRRRARWFCPNEHARAVTEWQAANGKASEAQQRHIDAAIAEAERLHPFPEFPY